MPIDLSGLGEVQEEVQQTQAPAQDIGPTPAAIQPYIPPPTWGEVPVDQNAVLAAQQKLTTRKGTVEVPTWMLAVGLGGVAILGWMAFANSEPKKAKRNEAKRLPPGFKTKPYKRRMK